MKSQIEIGSGLKIFGVTHRGTDGETRAYMQDGRVWINDDKGGWLRCHPGVEGYFSPNAANETISK